MTTENTIILIGAVRTSKSTLAQLLSEKLDVPRASLDELSRGYIQEIGYQKEVAQQIRNAGGFIAQIYYCKQFDPYAVERILAEHQTRITIWQ